MSNDAEDDLNGASEPGHPMEMMNPPASGKPRVKTPISVILAAILITILTVVCLQVDNWGRDWTTNTAETDPEAQDVNMRPIHSRLSTEKFAEIVVSVVEGVPRWSLENRDDRGKDMVRLDLVHRTFLMRFKDDVMVEIVKSEGGSSLYAKSQSRIGKGDLGQNPRNIKQLIAAIRDRLDPETIKPPK